MPITASPVTHSQLLLLDINKRMAITYFIATTTTDRPTNLPLTLNTMGYESPQKQIARFNNLNAGLLPIVERWEATIFDQASYAARKSDRSMFTAQLAQVINERVMVHDASGLSSFQAGLAAEVPSLADQGLSKALEASSDKQGRITALVNDVLAKAPELCK